MTVMKQVVGARTVVASTGFDTLAAGNYVSSEVINLTQSSPHDLIIEVRAASLYSPSGNKQIVVFAKESLDGTVFRSGPASGSSTIDEANLKFIGVVPMNTNAPAHTATFSLVQAFGYCPNYVVVVVKNDMGGTLSFGSIHKSEISITVT